MARAIYHGKRHYINSTKDHKPTMGVHDENAIVVMDANGLPVKDSRVQLSSLTVVSDNVNGPFSTTSTTPVTIWTIVGASVKIGVKYKLHWTMELQGGGNSGAIGDLLLDTVSVAESIQNETVAYGSHSGFLLLTPTAATIRLDFRLWRTATSGTVNARRLAYTLEEVQ